MIIEYAIAIISGMILDGIWLGIITKSLYQKYLGDLMLKNPRFIPAIIFYFIFALAVMVFVVTPALNGTWSLAHGALLGLVIYGGYDLTNLAILKGWPLGLSLLDIAWGITFSTLVSLATVYASKLFIK
jgi:uncharacterized membrane protein